MMIRKSKKKPLRRDKNNMIKKEEFNSRITS